MSRTATHATAQHHTQWEPLILAIGLCESYRVGLGWATPTGEGFNSLKDEYEMGNLR
jgi:light-harvesting complex I chlorophyll a/b binding protein 1